MNKILKTVASAAVAVFGFSAFAELPSVTATFDDLTPGEKTIAGLVGFNDSGTTVGSKYWFAVTNSSTKVDDDVIGVVTNNAHDSQYLSLDTTLPIYRTINAAPQPPYGEAPAGFTGEDISGGIYLDTMVKFTPADDVFKDSDLDEGDKIAISYVGESDSGITNKIVVRAGYVDGSTITPTNYIMNVPAEVDVTNWCHLIVRTIANVGSANAPVGFAIYLNDSPNPLTYDTGVEAGDQNYVDSLTGVAKAYLYTDSVHALLPSLVNTGIDKAKLSAVGFKGNGCIDDVAFKAGKPGFITEDITVTIAWDAGVATYTVVDNNNNTITNAAATGGSAGSVEFKLDPIAVSNLTVTATYDTANGYEAGKWTVTGEGAAISDGTFTVADGATLNINSMTPKFDVGGDHYGTFAEALDAAVTAGTSAEPATIQLLADVTEAMTFAEGYIVLDLNGKTIACGSGSRYVLANTGAVLKIIDTATGGIVAAGSSGSILIRGDAAFTTIEAGKYDGTIAITGLSEVEHTDILVVNGGTFYDVDYVDDPSIGFYLKDNVPTGVSISEPDNGYFTVGGGEPPAPTTFALTTTGGANATVTTDPVDVSALTGETEVTITATADQDYTYDGVDLTGTDWTYDSQTDAISMTTNISVNTTVVVPDAVSEQSQEDWPEGEDLIDAEGKAASDLFPGITNALATADAKAVATWAAANNVGYADKGSILPEAFLLNCANTQAAIDEAAANFKVTAITVVGDTVTITPADGADYGNGKVVIEGTATLSPISWHEKTDGDHFFRATLVVKPVAAP